jgi:hypothetical protein
MIRKTIVEVFENDHAQRTSSSNPAAGRNGQDARTIGRMDAIRNIKTMAGSPGAESATYRNQRPAILRMVFAF